MFKAELLKCFSIIAQIFSVLKNRIKLASFSMVSIRDIFAKYRQFALLNSSLSSIFFLATIHYCYAHLIVQIYSK